MAIKKSFNDLIHSKIPVLIDFSAEWCGPCKAMAPILKEVAVSVGEHAKIIKIDIDKNPQAAQSYNVQGVPTLIIFQHGVVKWRQSGVVPAKHLQHELEKLN